MGSFFKMLFASCLGVILGISLLVFIAIGIVGLIASDAEKPEKLQPNSVLHLTFSQQVPELANNVSTQSFSLEQNDIYGLQDIVAAIERAKNDKFIKGIFLDTDESQLQGFATTRSVREALMDFRKSGKFIVSHGKFYFSGNYYLASTADELYINPLGAMEVRGFAVQIPMYKDLLDRLGVRMQIYYAGKFKGATEPYRLNSLSPENKLQYREFLSDLYGLYLKDVAGSRKMTPDQLRSIIDSYAADSPERARQYGLADGVLTRPQVFDKLRKRLGLKESEKIHFVSLSSFIESNPEKLNFKEKQKIAVVYAEGSIMDGKGDAGVITDGQYVKTLEKLADDKNVKAVVLRVNSPGGSALASENILQAVLKVKSKGKPVVVSMGDYAASGGYYISCKADSIFAEPNTITGSIGVFRIIPSLENTLSEKAGVHFDSVKTGPFAAGLTLFFDNSPEEARKMQVSTDEMYEVFLQHVASGRKMTRDAVHEIAQGRVWSGEDALKNGLVDRLGTMDDAIRTAARMANLKNYRVADYPSIPDPIQRLVEELTSQKDEELRQARLVKSEFPAFYPLFSEWQAIRKSNGIQAKIPVQVPFK